ncbi:MAG: hypothetical protein ACI9U2_001179 [Bradymonadia bacterium]|jgi:hypothetical protein
MFTLPVWALIATTSSLIATDPIRIFGDPPGYANARLHDDMLVAYDGHGWRRTRSDASLADYVEWTHAHVPITWSPDLRLVLAQTADPLKSRKLFLHVAGRAPFELTDVKRFNLKAACSNTACAAATSGTEVTVWDESGAVRRTLAVASPRTPGVGAIALSQDARWLAAANREHAWQLYDLLDGEQFVAVSSEATPPPMGLELSPTADRILLKSASGIIEYAVANPRISRARPGRVHFAGYASDGRVALRQRDGRAERWDQGERFELVTTALPGAQAIAALQRHPSAAWSAALDAAGQVWAVEDGGAPVALAADSITAIRWLQTVPATLVATDKSGQVLQWRPGQPPKVLATLSTPAEWLTTAHDIILVAHGKTARLIDGRTGADLARWEHEAPIDGIGFETRTARPWKAVVRGGQIERQAPKEQDSGFRHGMAQTQFMPRYSTWQPDVGLHRTSSVQDGQHWPILSRTMLGAGGRVGRVVPVPKARLSADRNAIVTGHGKWPALLHRLPMSDATAIGWANDGLLAGDALGRFHHWIHHPAASAASPRIDGSSVALTESGDHMVVSAGGWVLVFDLTTRRLTWRGRWGKTTAGAAIAPDGSAVAHVDVLGHVHVRDLRTGLEWASQLRMPSKGWSVYPRSILRWRPDGQAVALTDQGGLVLIERATGAQSTIAVPGATALYHLAWSRDGQTVFAASAATAWALPLDGAPSSLLKLPNKRGSSSSPANPITGLAASPDGRRLLVRREREFNVLSLPSGQLVREPIAPCARCRERGPVVFLDDERFLSASSEGLAIWTEKGLESRVGPIPRRHHLVGLGATHRVLSSGGIFQVIDRRGQVRMRIAQPSDNGLAWQADGRFECTASMGDRIGLKTSQGWRFGGASPELRARRGWAD